MKKIILILFITSLGLVAFLYLGKLFSPGSYANAEEYEFSVAEPVLISSIKEFKNENPQYKVPEDVGVFEGRRNAQDHWYHIYFYYPQEKQIIYILTRPAGKDMTTLSLVGINNGHKLGKWKDINRDFSGSENDEQIRKFDERILAGIKIRIKH